MEKDILEYITGSVVNKFISKYPYLGEKVPRCTDDSSSWTEQMAKVNLIKPSSDMMNISIILETIFNQFHGNKGLNKSTGTKFNNY